MLIINFLQKQGLSQDLEAATNSSSLEFYSKHVNISQNLLQNTFHLVPIPMSHPTFNSLNFTQLLTQHLKQALT